MGLKKTVRKWGNGSALAIPKDIMGVLDLEVGSEVDLTIRGKTLVMTPVRGGTVRP